MQFDTDFKEKFHKELLDKYLSILRMNSEIEIFKIMRIFIRNIFYKTRVNY